MRPMKMICPACSAVAKNWENKQEASAVGGYLLLLHKYSVRAFVCDERDLLAHHQTQRPERARQGEGADRRITRE